VREKQLNASGLTTGSSAAQPLLDAKYIFEGAITEANAGQTQRSAAFNIGGAELGASKGTDVLAIDVRVVEVATGELVNVVTVRKTIVSDSTSFSGIGSLIGTVLAGKGRNAAYVPDLRLQQQRKESIDLALRAVIDEAVIQLASRLP